MGTWLRHPKTTQERREWLYALELARQYPELRIRRARSHQYLPTVYDDIQRPAGESNWKLYRKTQYKIKKTHQKNTRARFVYDYPNRELCLNPHRKYIWSLWLWRGEGQAGPEIKINHRRGRFKRAGYVYWREKLAYRKPKYVPDNQGNTQPTENGFSHSPSKGLGKVADGQSRAA